MFQCYTFSEIVTFTFRQQATYQQRFVGRFLLSCFDNFIIFKHLKTYLSYLLEKYDLFSSVCFYITIQIDFISVQVSWF